MDHRQLMRALAAGRIVVGVALVALPRTAGKQWIGDPALDRSVTAMTRAMGIRDLALGAGTLRALGAGDPARSWVLLGGMSDAVDLVGTGLAMRSIGLRRALPVMVVAAGAATLSLLAADQLD